MGAVVGFYVTGTPQGAQWGWMIGPSVGGYEDPAIIANDHDEEQE